MEPLAEAGRRIRAFAGGDNLLVLAHDTGELADFLATSAVVDGVIVRPGEFAAAVWLHHCRGLALPGAGGRADRDRAGELALVLGLDYPEHVPEGLRPQTAVAAVNAAPRLLEQARLTRERDSIDALITVARLAIEWGKESTRTAGMVNLATGLAVRFEAAGDPADLDGAIDNLTA